MKTSSAPKTVQMVATGSQCSIVAGNDEVYRPDENGIWQIPEHHVDLVRSHGLVDQSGPLVATKKTSRETINILQAENDRLKAELAKRTNSTS